jgi:hypothetical protein
MSLSPGTSTHNDLTIECGRRTAWVYDDNAPKLIRRAGVKRSQKDRHRGAWMVPIWALWDIIAVAENVQKRTVHLVEVER